MAGTGGSLRDKAEEYGPFAAAGTSQRGRGNSAQRVQQERAGSDSADCIPEQFISALLMEIPTLMQQKTVHVLLAQGPHPQSHEPADGAGLGESAGQLQNLSGHHRVLGAACQLGVQVGVYSLRGDLQHQAHGGVCHD
ncbi:uncharacterized protein LOC128093067 [Culex pipiens pallens]|uniref:uncharacterized protein LOC128093067 n=1 Tax=Culex pipiens pallens TaxID=42434 RepID=UPI0022AA1FA7|nr:uncharacterized protein LOC128093067 [Culex pipiens pallens]